MRPIATLHSLIGMECEVTFIGEPLHWPFQQWQSPLSVQAVDMPMVLLSSGDRRQWVNAALIATIKPLHRVDPVSGRKTVQRLTSAIPRF